MKIRNSFVSNSSSSSFLVFGEPPKECNYAKLNKAQVEKVLKHLKKDSGYYNYSEEEYDNPDDIDVDFDNVYLTEFIDEGDSLYFCYTYDYVDGGHSGPYGKEDYDLIFDNKSDYGSVWILKEHNK